MYIQVARFDQIIVISKTVDKAVDPEQLRLEHWDVLIVKYKMKVEEKT